MRRLATALAATAILAPAPISAGEDLVDGEAFQLRLGGYASEFASVRNLPYDTAGFIPEDTGQASGVLRLEWDAQFGELVSVQLHNRLFHSIGTGGVELGNQLGLGASVAPERTLDTRSVLIEGDGLLVEHDLDRAVARVFTGFGDIYVGRQAITWGNSYLFTGSDIWTRFSPFELDTSQKRGVDAVRYLGYPGSIELDLVVEWTDIDAPGAGARASWTLDRTDSYGAVAWRDDELMGLMGVVVDLDLLSTRAEFALPYDLEDGRLRLPRATVGVDYLKPTWSAIVEYHYNGPGTSEGDYIGQAQAPDVVAGDRYLLGRHYAGAVGSWIPNETYTVSVATFVNLSDPSALIAPTATVTLSQNVTFSAGAYVGLGGHPTILPTPDLPSEFGAAGTTGFVQMTGYY